MARQGTESCMDIISTIHFNLKVSVIKGGFERACVALFDQDNQTFTESLLLNLDNLEKQLDREEFQETESIGVFRVLMKQFQIIHQFFVTVSYDLIGCNKSIDERAQHKQENNRRVNDRVIQSKEGKVDSSKALDTDINSVNDKQPMAEVQLSAEHNILANEQQHSKQSESVYDTYLLEKAVLNLSGALFQSHGGRDISSLAILERVNCVLRISGLYTLRLLDAACKTTSTPTSPTTQAQVTYVSESVSYSKKKVNEELRKFVGGRLYEGDLRLPQKNHMIASYDVLIIQDCDGIPKRPAMFLNLWRYKVVRHRYSNPMIQPEPEGSTQGYPLVSVEVLRFYTSAGNPVKEILLKLNLPDHRILKDGGEVLKLKNFKKYATLKLFNSINQEWYEHVGPEVTRSQDDKVTRWRNEIMLG
ncbi:hypothetical protein Tco_0710655 [Tanacetum coccineum]